MYGWAMCNCNSMDTKAAILVELAFMTNEKEATTMMANEAFWKESAQEKLNAVIPSWLPKLAVDGSYGPKQE